MTTLTDNRTRGIRNNNPGNIIKTECSSWRGEIGEDAQHFIIFSELIYGVRAEQKLLIHYSKTLYPFDIKSVITSWSGCVGDKLQSYITYVSRYISVKPLDKLTFPDQLIALCEAINAFENGGIMLPLYLYHDAYYLLQKEIETHEATY